MARYRPARKVRLASPTSHLLAECFEVSWSERSPEAATALVQAFVDEPGASASVLRPRARRSVIANLLRAMTDDAARRGGLLTATVGGNVVAAACVWPPGYHPMPLLSRRYLVAGAETVWRAGRRTLRILGLWRAMRAADPAAEHWHVALLGVDPTWQRIGIGRSLMAAIVERADQKHGAIYLETNRRELVGWYEAAGFVVRDELTVASPARVWTMWRSVASTSRSAAGTKTPV
jgi:ribosomal protein S18 acetylase RimI-like enzyme